MIISLKIDFNQATGQINLTGPISEKVLCYGLLEAAKDLIRDLKPSPVQIASVVPK